MSKLPHIMPERGVDRTTPRLTSLVLGKHFSFYMYIDLFISVNIIYLDSNPVWIVWNTHTNQMSRTSFQLHNFTYYLWLGLSHNYNDITLVLRWKEELVMCTDKLCGTEKKYRNIKDHNNKFLTLNDMLLLFTPFSINHLVFQLHCRIVLCNCIS